MLMPFFQANQLFCPKQSLVHIPKNDIRELKNEKTGCKYQKNRPDSTSPEG